ncbi:hypothetical protein [Actinocorallia populi]|uniref:hypothetical protein n=1 Tax=Actinocorallia populi TaxID=2079200 RepID=UPI0013008405|nr:hypothetical protein [Actinocorallia populi]
MTHEEVLRECRRILEDGKVEAPSFTAPVSGTFPLNCDIAEDIAVVTFITSMPDDRSYCSEHYVFERADGAWEYLGGGSASMDSPCPVRLPRTGLGGAHLRLTGHGLTRRRRPALFPERRWIVTAELQLCDEAAALLLNDRPVTVPGHGIVSAVWPTLQPATATALAADGRALSSLVLEPRTWFHTPE